MRLCDGEVGGGSGGVNAICSQSEAYDDVIVSQDVEPSYITFVYNYRATIIRAKAFGCGILVAVTLLQ